jgi:hypothetical protein
MRVGGAVSALAVALFLWSMFRSSRRLDAQHKAA